MIIFMQSYLFICCCLSLSLQFDLNLEGRGQSITPLFASSRGIQIDYIRLPTVYGLQTNYLPISNLNSPTYEDHPSVQLENELHNQMVHYNGSERESSHYLSTQVN